MKKSLAFLAFLGASTAFAADVTVVQQVTFSNTDSATIYSSIGGPEQPFGDNGGQKSSGALVCTRSVNANAGNVYGCAVAIVVTNGQPSLANSFAMQVRNPASKHQK